MGLEQTQHALLRHLLAVRESFDQRLQFFALARFIDDYNRGQQSGEQAHVEV